MAVSTTDTYSGPYAANGVTVEFPFTFKALTSDDVGVFIRDSGNDTVVSTDTYSVVLAAEGGTVVMLAPPSVGELYIYSEPSFLQPVNFAAGQPFLPSVVNSVNDKDVVRALYLKDQVNRSPKVPIGGGAENRFPIVKPDGSWGFSVGTGNDPAFRADVSSPAADKGAALVTYRSPASGAVARTLSAKLRDLVNVKDFGAVGNGIADDTAAIQKAIDYTFSTPNGGGTVFFPDGRYKISAALQINGSGISLVGHSPNAAQLVNTSLTAHLIEMGATAGVNEGNRIEGMGFSASLPKTGGAAIYVHNAVNLVLRNIRCIENIWDGISLQGDTGPTLGIYIDHFDLKLIRNIGIDIGSVAGATDTFISNGLIRPATGAAYGIRMVQAYGVYGQNVDITNFGPSYFTHGILISPGAGQQSNAIMLTNFLSDSSNGANLMVSGAGVVADVQIVASWFNTSTTDNGVSLNNPNLDGFRLAKSTVNSNAKIGVLINAGKNVAISGCSILSNSRSAANTYSGVVVAANVSQFLITGNIIGTGGYFATIGAAGIQRHAIDINIGSSNGYIVAMNRGAGNASGFIVDNGTGSDKYVAGNIGA